MMFPLCRCHDSLQKSRHSDENIPVAIRSLPCSVLKITCRLTKKMAGKKIVIFLGSAREGRQGGKVANYVKSVLDKMGMSAQIFGI